MPGQIAAMSLVDLAQAKVGGDIERSSAVWVQILAKENLPMVVEADQALVEGQVKVWCQQKAVERIEPLCPTGDAPGFDV